MHALALSDPRWASLQGGYRVPYDASVSLHALADGAQPEAIWEELWNELHHQGDVGEASYAAVSWLVDICINRKIVDWNLFHLINVIEVCRTQSGNPPLPGWIAISYQEAWAKLFDYGLAALRWSNDGLLVRSVLATIALHKAQPKIGRILTDLDESELKDIYEQLFEEE
jgi:hypothetical protein